MFTAFLYELRGAGLKVSPTEWLALMEALALGHAKSNLEVFYDLSRALLIKKESQYDLFDRVFASHFKGVEGHFEVDDALMEWLQNPQMPRTLTPEELAQLEAWDLDRLREELEKRRREQTKRHDGGSRWIGTGGTSPFGHGGTNPAGIRVGGEGGGRSAVQIASARRFRNLRQDRVLDTRMVGSALRRLRRLARNSGPEELDIDATVDTSAKNGGEIDLIFSPARANRVKLLLLMDVGGSMDPYAEVCEQLFSAAHKANHFKAFRYYFFHNCIYERLYDDISRYRGPLTSEVLRVVDATWSVILVGDAWMAPYELTHAGGHIFYGYHNRQPGIAWLRKLRERVPNAVWLNPEPPRIWHADTIRLIHQIFPMFHLTLNGLTEAVDVLRGAKPNVPLGGH